MLSSPLIIFVVVLQVIAIVKPIAAQNCTSCTLPGTNPSLGFGLLLLNTTITNGTSPITGCATVTFVCPEGSFVYITYSAGYYTYLQYDLIEHTLECGPSGFGLVYEEVDEIVYYPDEFSENYYNFLDVSSIQCYTIPCNQSICPLSLIQFNVGNPNQCDQSMVVTNTFTDRSTSCIDIIVYCQHPSFTLYEVLVNGSVQNATAHGNYDKLYCQSSPTSGFYSHFISNNPLVSQVYCSNLENHEFAFSTYQNRKASFYYAQCKSVFSKFDSAASNAPTNCSLVSAPAACSAPMACYQCGNSCAVLNYPNTNIARQINPQFTFNGQPYTSTIYANGLAECGNRLFTTQYPTTSNTSVNATLKSGQFIGVFTCPFAMCVCTDPSNGTIDCFRGNSSVQILLVPVATPSPNSKAVILGIVLQSIISSPFGSWSPPSNLNNLPALIPNNYVKINHLACVSGSSASCPIAA